MSRATRWAAAAVLAAAVSRAAAPPGPWKQLEPGLSIARMPTGRQSRLGDAKLTAVRVDPARFALKLLCAAQLDSVNRTVKEWCEAHALIAAVNAGMYGTDYSTHVGYLKNYKHVNNPRVRGNYKAVLAFNPAVSTVPPVQIIDFECQDFAKLRAKYNSLVQNIRMISCNRTNVWRQQEEKWSVAALAIDTAGNVLLLFSQSPYTVHDFIDIVLQLPLSVRNAMYLEGGGPAALYLKRGDFVLEKYGLHESAADDANAVASPRRLPNVIGVVKRKR